MPPINQQGSRAGLITALVVFVILFVTSTMFAIKFRSEWQASDNSNADLQKKYNEVVSLDRDTALLQELSTVRTENAAKFDINPNDLAINVAVRERDKLSKAITGHDGSTPVVAVDTAESSLKTAVNTLKAAKIAVALPASGLGEAVTTLAKKVVAQQDAVNTLTRDLAEKNKQIAADNDTIANVNKAMSDALDKAHADADAQHAADTKTLADKDAVVASLNQDKDALTKTHSDADAKAAADLALANQQLTKAKSELVATEAKLGARRADVTNPIVRQTDGKLIRVPNNDICYINLGYGDQVTPGLTFEVYDKTEGVPPIPPNVTGDEELPVGKASIEITKVGATSSECRIVHITPGAVLSEGDLIANLVYDPHTKYNFFVYGKFDLAESGRPNAADTEVIKRLVTQWGGKLTDQVNVDTDFVVLGSEPVLPTFSKDDLTAENQDKLQKAQEDLDRYQELRQEAKDLHIPVMNQNRFLYYVGFYDQAKR
jgi:hypothetical protein